MYRHIRLYCKVALTGINKEESIQLKFQNQINHLSNTVDTLLKQNIELKKEKNIIQPILTNVQNIETQNVQNIETANVQNNNITINILPFPEMNIKHDDILNPFLKENSASALVLCAKIPYLDKVDVAKNDANNQLISTALVEMVENVYSESENRNIYFLKIA